jgi:hypothetical protein
MLLYRRKKWEYQTTSAGNHERAELLPGNLLHETIRGCATDSPFSAKQKSALAMLLILELGAFDRIREKC